MLPMSKFVLCSVCQYLDTLIMDTLQPPYNGQTVRPLPVYFPYISTSEEGGQNARPQCVHYSEVPL